MTPADEARFIALWTAGRTSAAIAQTLGIPRGTVSTRARRLVAQGKIQARPRGGAYPRQQGLARMTDAGTPQPTPVHRRLSTPRHTLIHPPCRPSSPLQYTRVYP